MTAPATRRAALRRLFAPSGARERRRLADLLRTETVGGALLLGAAVLALIWANSPWRDAYTDLLAVKVGPQAWHLRLDLAHWAADGLLAIFFFVAGLELKHELLVGDLRDPRKALLPVVAAACGVVVPALIYLSLTASDPTARHGWAIPVATDIAFALAVLAVVGSHLPAALRSFLLTLAVVDDLIAITIIAIFYTADLDPVKLLLALAPLAAFAVVARTGGPAGPRVAVAWTLVPLALLTWGLIHASGIHATVAGVLLAFTVPVRPRARRVEPFADRLEHLLRPVSAGFVVPVFAFAAAGVTVVGGDAGGVWTDRVTIAIAVALVVGKLIGVLGGTWLTARFTRADLDEGLSWADVTGAALLAGIGFTVSLLVGDLAFSDPERDAAVKVGVLGGSTLAALLAATVLLRRNRVHRRTAQDTSTP
ncbi:MAG: Na+/H+ antiporter NhaA [Kineosporiaceae bacterium]